VSVGNWSLVPASESDTLCATKKLAHLWWQPTPNIVSLVSAAYISRHQKSIFGKKHRTQIIAVHLGAIAIEPKEAVTRGEVR
jgi:hypothetical protein